MFFIFLPIFKGYGNGLWFVSQQKSRFVPSRCAEFWSGIVGKTIRLGGDAQEVFVQFAVVVQVLKTADGILAGGKPLKRVRQLRIAPNHQRLGSLGL